MTKTILKSSKWKTLKQPVYFLRAVEFWPTFDIQISLTLAIFWGKVTKLHFFRNPTEVSQNMPAFIFKKNDKFVFY